MDATPISSPTLLPVSFSCRSSIASIVVSSTGARSPTIFALHHGGDVITAGIITVGSSHTSAITGYHRWFFAGRAPTILWRQFCRSKQTTRLRHPLARGQSRPVRATGGDRCSGGRSCPGAVHRGVHFQRSVTMDCWVRIQRRVQPSHGSRRLPYLACAIASAVSPAPRFLPAPTRHVGVLMSDRASPDQLSAHPCRSPR